MFWASSSLHRFDIDAYSIHTPRLLTEARVCGFEGSAAGAAFGLNGTVSRALGEFVERRHFMHRVSACGCYFLGEYDAGEECLVQFYSQLSAEQFDWPRVKLSACRVLRWRDWQPCLMPRNLVSLGHTDLRHDFVTHPNRDSSGMAAHVDETRALEHAAMEFVERQTWIAWWLGGATATRINGIDAFEPARRDIDENLSAYVLDAGLGGYTVFAYGIDRQRGAFGLYSGLSCALNAGQALQKALSEAAHARAFLTERNQSMFSVRTGDEWRVSGRLERNAATFHIEGRTTPLSDLLATPSLQLSALVALPRCSLNDIRENLLSVSQRIYVYLAQERSILGRHSVARVLSPDFYAHVDPGKPLNYFNDLGNRLGITIPKAYRRISTCLA